MVNAFCLFLAVVAVLTAFLDSSSLSDGGSAVYQPLFRVMRYLDLPISSFLGLD